jgi:rare lipoprotein A
VDQRKVTLTLASLFIAGSAFISAPVAQAEPAKTSGKVVQSGPASWYGPGFHGRKTASGETFNSNDMTAAHRTLPFGTKVRVTNSRTGKSVIVRINDRGPFIRGRIIDLSRAAAGKIGMVSSGHAAVCMVRT